jgi:hypothetical protein
LLTLYRTPVIYRAYDRLGQRLRGPHPNPPPAGEGAR